MLVGSRMDSSFDAEDGPDFNHPNVLVSTPKRARLECPVCNKLYQLHHYYQKHVKTHSSEGDQTLDESALHLDASEVSLSALRTKDDSQVFKKPAPKKRGLVTAGRKNTFSCTYCLKAYVSEKSMQKHMRIHTMQVAAARFPKIQELLDGAADIGDRAMLKVANSPSYGKSGQQFRELIGHITASHNFGDFSAKVMSMMTVGLEARKCLLPSALMKTLFDEMENILCDDKCCDECLELLEVSPFESDTTSQFFLEFLLNFTSGVFQFISNSFRRHYQRQVKPMPELDAEDRQVVYYIAGSIMRGYLRIAYRHKNNLKWQKISSVLKSNVLSPEPLGDCDAAWTKEVDRGGLLYITMPCQKFFLSLTKVVFEKEQKNGSIDYNEVIKIVTNSNISVEWDEIIKDSLPEELSLGLMTDVVMCFCKACGRGIARRRLNALRKKPVISMPTRHAVASRKK